MIEHIYNEREKKLMQDYWDHRSKEPRQNLIELVKIIDPKEKKGQESWGYIMLDRLLTDEMVDFLLNMELGVPLYIDELAEKSGKTVEEAARLADDLAHIGVIGYSPDKDGVDRVVLIVFVVGSMEAISCDNWRFDQYTEEAVAFRNYAVETAAKFAPILPISNCGIHRVVPVEEAIQNETKHASWEELTTLVEKSAGNVFAVTECVCRKVTQKYGESTGEPEFEWCLQLGRFAESSIRTGKARKITKEEFYDILADPRKKGSFMLYMAKSISHIFAIVILVPA